MKEIKTKLLTIVLPVTIFFLLTGCLAKAGGGTENTFSPSPVLFAVSLLVICIVIGILAVMSGTGGGVIFTPLMLGFTQIDSYIIRATGIFIAMSGALIAARPYFKRGIANIRLLIFSAVPYSIFAIIGALLAGYIDTHMGMTGEALIRGVLGILVVGIGFVFIFAGNRTDYPVVNNVDSFSKKMGFGMSYWESSLNKNVSYQIKRTLPGLILLCAVGLISGLFGLGAGWAIVPVFNLVLLAPLKVAAACSTVLISMGDTAAIWPYVLGGGLFPLIAIPCLLGMIMGTHIGSKIMLKSKPTFVRWIIIAIMFGAGIKLITKSLSLL